MWSELRHPRKQEVKLRAKTPSTTKTRNVERSNVSQNYGGKFSRFSQMKLERSAERLLTRIVNASQ